MGKTILLKGQLETTVRSGKVVTENRTGKIITELKATVIAAASVFEPEYQAVLDYATGQGFTLPSSGQQTKQNQLVIDLKAQGVWLTNDILYVFATDGDRNFAKINWKSPGTYQLSESGSMIFTVNQGFTGAAASRLLTPWVPSVNGVNYTLNDCSICFYINTDLDHGGADVGARHSSAGTAQRILSITRDGSAANRGSHGVNGSTLVTANASVPTSVGFWHSKRNSSLTSGQLLHRNGILVDNSGQASVGIPDNQVSILGDTANNGTLQGATSSLRQMSFISFGASLTGKESAFYNAWNTYFTSL